MTSRASLLIVAPQPERRSPGQRFRFEQYLDAWRDHGIDATVAPLLETGDLDRIYRSGGVAAKVGVVARAAAKRLSHLVSIRRYDVAFVYREAFPVGPPVFEWAIRRLGVPYVLDFDDAIWLPSTSEANRRFAPLKFSRKTGAIARGAALVTVGNDHLAEWVRPFQPNVRVIPTTIDTTLYQPAPREDDGVVRIGWSGSLTTVQHLRTVEQVLRDVQRASGATLRVIGAPAYKLDGADVEVLPWREATELDDLRPIDIGIMPLPDDEWARGKCGLKALQYMALGIPTVMSPVGVNREIAEGGAALLASDDDEWRETLLRLINDAALRRTLGEAGRARVEERYSVDAVAPLWVDAVRSALDRS